MEQEGVSLDALEHAVRGDQVGRSNSTLLVKNLPFTATEEDLRTLFGRSGQLMRLVLPPTRAIALVEFVEPKDAKYVCVRECVWVWCSWQ